MGKKWMAWIVGRDGVSGGLALFPEGMVLGFTIHFFPLPAEW